MKEMEFITIVKGRSLYKLFLVDIKRVYKLDKKKKISVPVFEERRGHSCPTKGGVEDNDDSED